MTQVSLQYAAGPPLSKMHEEMYQINGNDHTAIADLDDSETLYTADFTLTAAEQAAFFVITTTGDTTAGHTAAITLMTGTTHALACTQALVRADQSAPALPAATITLDMGTAADRNVIIHVSPAALDSAGAQVGKIISLRFVGAGSLSNLVVRVTLVTYELRSQR